MTSSLASQLTIMLSFLKQQISQLPQKSTSLTQVLQYINTLNLKDKSKRAVPVSPFCIYKASMFVRSVLDKLQSSPEILFNMAQDPVVVGRL